MGIKTDSRTFKASTKTPFGASYNELTGQLEFTLRSPDATDVTLCIFEKAFGEDPIRSIDMSIENGAWKTSFQIDKKVLQEKPIYYGYRLFGPNWQKAADFKAGIDAGSGFVTRFDENTGFRFNPNKLAVDPYAQWSHNPDKADDQRVFRGSLEMFMCDTAKVAPKSMYRLHADIDMPKVYTKRSLADEDFIAEVHMKDLTFLVQSKHGEIKSKKGTYKAAAEFAPELKKMGITMVEFLPLNEFNTDPERNSDLKNYWGYMPLTFFGLTSAYSESGDALDEFRQMVKAFHENDIKVCMDVVYNHDGETGHCSEDKNDVKYFSHTPIADNHYHRLKSNGKYRDNTGCGGDFNVTSKLGQELVADALAFFAKLGVDAFRLDLAAALMDVGKGHNPIKYEPHNAECLAQKLSKMLEERGVKVDAPNENNDGINLIAEPWNCSCQGDGSQYQAGKFPDNWAEWSDITREFIKRETFQPYNVPVVDLIEYYDGFIRTYGQSNTGGGNKLPVNYVSSHDEYTMLDINTNMNKSTPHQEREAAVKKQITMLFLARGIPMLQVGDLIGHSKCNQHNTYNQDNDLNYLDYSKAMDINSEPIDTEQGRIFNYAKSLSEFRKNNPVLARRKAGENIEYFSQKGISTKNDRPENLWNKSIDFFGMLISGEKRIFVASSKSENSMLFVLPENECAKKWYGVCDSSDMHAKVFPKGNKKAVSDKELTLLPQSVSVFIEK